jgi:hypothetical protein
MTFCCSAPEKEVGFGPFSGPLRYMLYLETELFVSGGWHR